MHPTSPSPSGMIKKDPVKIDEHVCMDEIRNKEKPESARNSKKKEAV
jgi:hypothetical protein